MLAHVFVFFPLARLLLAIGIVALICYLVSLIGRDASKISALKDRVDALEKKP